MSKDTHRGLYLQHRHSTKMFARCCCCCCCYCCCCCSVSPKYAQEHQVAVIDCLEDPDETLKLKTLELLVTMTKSNNVQVWRRVMATIGFL